MEVTDPNNVKIYNLSAGKSLPEWLNERKRRALQKKDVDIRKRIELIQDFDMPGVSTNVKVSSDGQYILATGIYKPRVKCFDVNNLSLKFERGFDSEVVTFQILSEDYSKLVFLQCDRYVEFHSAQGRYFRLRIPKFGRDMKYHFPTCDLYLVGVGSEIYRLNLERGQFLNPLVTDGSEINKCAVNSVHQLFVCGSKEGKVEGFDPRSRTKVGVLDVALDCVSDSKLENFPSITALNFEGGLNLGVGTASGHVLLYDIRSNKPYIVKDHMYGLPIRDIEYQKSQNLVLSMDSSILKIWEQETGKLFTSIEAKTDFNNLCLVPNSGLLFIANENTKILTYYIPSLGAAPKWCGFLDNITEELEESKLDVFYDDYKFITKKEVEDLGFADLIGTNMLRAYMHGYFIDIRLYKKAKLVGDPFELDKYKKKKIREKIDQERSDRVKMSEELPAVNKELALKLKNDEENQRKKKNKGPSLLKDDRFKALFENPDFQVDKTTVEYRLLNPVVSRLEKTKKKEKRNTEEDEELEGRRSTDEDSESSSDDDREWTKEVRRQHKLIKHEQRLKEKEEEKKMEVNMYEVKEVDELKKKKSWKKSLEDRLREERRDEIKLHKGGNREMKFRVKKEKKDLTYAHKVKKHQEERRNLMRPADSLLSKVRSNFLGRKRPF